MELLSGVSDYEINFRLMINLMPEFKNEIINFTEDMELLEHFLFPRLKRMRILEFIDTSDNNARRLSENILITYYDFKELL